MSKDAAVDNRGRLLVLRVIVRARDVEEKTGCGRSLGEEPAKSA